MTESGGTGAENGDQARWLTRGTASVSLASFFSDSGHEITTSILPTFVISVLRSSAAVLGIIEGLSDALLGVAALITGSLANDPAARRGLARGGYLATAAATGAIGASAVVWQAGLLRAIAWIARGSRSPARDSLLSSLVSPSAYGRAFGLERAGDNLGAVAGPLLAALLIGTVGVRDTLYLAAVPGAFAAVAITAAARAAADREPSTAQRRVRQPLAVRRVLSSGLARPAFAIGLFECGNCATTLLILRATDLLHGAGRSVVAATTLAVLLYASNNLLGAGSALVGGRWIDRHGPRRSLAVGAALLAGSYAIFSAGPGGWPVLLAAFVLSGSGIGLAEPAESALVAANLPDGLRGSGFGLLGGLQAAGGLVASASLGLLWWLAGPTVAFLCATSWMLAAILATALIATPGQLRSHTGDRRAAPPRIDTGDRG